MVVLAIFRQRFKIDEGATFTPVDTFFLGKPSPEYRSAVADRRLRSAPRTRELDPAPDQYQQAKAQPLTVYEWRPQTPLPRHQFNLRRPFERPTRARGAGAGSEPRRRARRCRAGSGTPAFSFIAQANTKWLNPNVERFDYNWTCPGPF
jgi:hypothetical protein